MNVRANVVERHREALLAVLRDVADPDGSPDDVVTVLFNPSGTLAKDTREGVSGGSPMVLSGTLAVAVAITSASAMERLLTFTTSSPVYGMIYGRPEGVKLTDGVGQDVATDRAARQPSVSCRNDRVGPLRTVAVQRGTVLVLP